MKNSVYTCLWASSHTQEEREQNDYYATDPSAIVDLVNNMNFDKEICIWEPACWEWHLSKQLQKLWFRVISSDLIHRWFWKWGVDFLWCTKNFNWNIITNPPYKFAKEFIEKSLSLIPDGNFVAMFLKLTFLESISRRDFFEMYPPAKILVFSKRKQCAKNGDFDKYKSNAVCYCWMIWKKGLHTKPFIEWI